MCANGLRVQMPCDAGPGSVVRCVRIAAASSGHLSAESVFVLCPQMCFKAPRDCFGCIMTKTLLEVSHIYVFFNLKILRLPHEYCIHISPQLPVVHPTLPLSPAMSPQIYDPWIVTHTHTPNLPSHVTCVSMLLLLARPSRLIPGNGWFLLSLGTINCL